MTFDEKAEKYAEETNLDENTYRGDVVTAYVCGAMEAGQVEGIVILNNKTIKEAFDEWYKNSTLDGVEPKTSEFEIWKAGVTYGANNDIK